MKKILLRTVYLFLFAAFVFLFWKCPFKALTGMECPACNLTRASVCLIKLDFQAAFEYHPLVFIIIPLVLFLVCDYVFDLKTGKKILYPICISVFSLMIIVWLYRLLSGDVHVRFDFSRSVISKFFKL